MPHASLAERETAHGRKSVSIGSERTTGEKGSENTYVLVSHFLR
jgi:hypothetical protein